jgi:hypothetical protein
VKQGGFVTQSGLVKQRSLVKRARRCTLLAALAASLVVPALLAGCGGSGGGDEALPAGEALPPVGPIPGAEFAKVPPPTFNQVITAFRSVTTANPALLNDEPALSRALFDEVKRITTTAVAGEAARRLGADGITRRLAAFNLDSKLTLEEWKLVIRRPLASARAAPTIEISAQAAIDAWPCDADVEFADGKADAFRHAYWNALMARRVSPAFAELFASAHEVGSSNTPAASAMDLHNNAFGRAFAARLAAAGESELAQLLLQQPFSFVAPGAAIPAALPGMAFIAERGRRAFDGRLAGTLTQPDSGPGAWALEADFAQCGNVLRGLYRASRAGVTVERRFSGAIGNAGAVTLSVADPLPFEPAAAQSPCLAMQATLAGNEQALAGAWTSSSCAQGGSIELRRQQ